MSNRRKNLQDRYRRGFLRSPAWFTRRDRWFAHEQQVGRSLVCAGCRATATRATLELHHLDYAGVTLRAGRWMAGEKHDDLIALHPYCHELLHRLMDRDLVLSRHRTRRDATQIALTRLRPGLVALAKEASR